MSRYANVSSWVCTECGAQVSDAVKHDAFHDRIDRLEDSAVTALLWQEGHEQPLGPPSALLNVTVGTSTKVPPFPDNPTPTPKVLDSGTDTPTEGLRCAVCGEPVTEVVSRYNQHVRHYPHDHAPVAATLTPPESVYVDELGPELAELLRASRREGTNEPFRTAYAHLIERAESGDCLCPSPNPDCQHPTCPRVAPEPPAGTPVWWDGRWWVNDEGFYYATDGAYAAELWADMRGAIPAKQPEEFA